MTHVAIDPGLVLALADRFARQSRDADDSSRRARTTAGAVGLDAPRASELEMLAVRWSIAADTLQRRALLAAGFRVALPSLPTPPRPAAPTSGVRHGMVDHAVLLVGDALIDGLSAGDLRSIADALALLNDTELSAWWEAMDDAERRQLVAALAADPTRSGLLVLIADAARPTTARIDGATLVGHLAIWFPVIEAAGSDEPDGALSFEELDRARHAGLPGWLGGLADHLAASPTWFTNLALVRSDQGLTVPFSTSELEGIGEITVADLDEAMTFMAVADLLIDPAVFDRLDAAKNGEHNGHVSADDLRLAIDGNWFGPRGTPLLEFLLDGDRLGLLELSDDRALDQWDTGGSLHWTDVVALGANLHAWADSPARTRQVLDWLPHAYDEVAGADGLDVRLVSDDGVRALAAAGLSGVEDLVGQSLVIGALPESRGGERNRLITAWYSLLALEMNEVLNADLPDPMDPTSPGHTGANWMLMAPWASNSLRPQLIGEPVLELPALPDTLSSASVGDRQQLADGNQYIFGDIAPRYAAFVERWADGPVTEPDELAAFFDGRLDDGRPMFGPGHDQLRAAFVHFAAAAAATDPVLRQELTFAANSFVAIHEQAGVQPELDALTDLSIGDDGLLRGTFGELLPGGDALWATSFIALQIGHGSDPVMIDVERDLDPDRFDHTNNRLIGTDLTTDLNPSTIGRVGIGPTSVSWDGAPADLRLGALGGWSAPPDGSGMEEFPTSSAEWFERGTNNNVVFPGTHPTIWEEAGGTAGHDLRGTGAFDWGDPSDRMWNIANLFHQMHTDPVLWERQHEVGIDRVDDGVRAFDWLPAEAADRLSRRSPRG